MSVATKPTNAEYHADTDHVGHSMMSVYRKSPPAYNAYYNAKTEPVPPPTAAMAFGSLFHCVVLESAFFASLYRIATGCKDRRTKAWQTQEAAAKAEGLLLALQADVDKAHAMREAVLRHPIARKLLEADGPVEEAIYWVDGTGVACKCKPDKWILPGTLCDITVDLNCDLKSATDPSPVGFRKAVVNYEYHCQMGHYLDGVESKAGRPVAPVHIVCGNEWPHDVWTYSLPAAGGSGSWRDIDVQTGRTQNIETLSRLRESLDRDVWMGEGQNSLITLE
jgi:exodeoxyribonuclease VIII